MVRMRGYKTTLKDGREYKYDLPDHDGYGIFMSEEVTASHLINLHGGSKWIAKIERTDTPAYYESRRMF